MANPLQFDKYKLPEHPDCRRCDEMLTDAVDEGLGEMDQLWFDRHVTGCMACQQALAEAQRGAAWLTLLKAPRPEPSSMLLGRILAQTSVGTEPVKDDSFADHLPAPAKPYMVPGVLPFRPRLPQLPPMARMTRMMFEPRLAMTAAMAFFSIALTMNLTGVRLDQMHASNLKPASLKRTYYEATATAARRYEGLRVVHVLESRVDDLRGENGVLPGRELQQERPESRRGVTAEPEKALPEKRVPESVKPDKQPDRDPHGISRRDGQGTPRRLAVGFYGVALKKMGGLA